MIPLLIDITLVLLFALFLWIGWRRGLVASLMGFLSLLIAFAGAHLLASAFAPAVGTWIAPSVETALVERYHLPQDGQTALPTDDPMSAAEDETGSDPALADALERAGLGSIAPYITNAVQGIAGAGSGIVKTASQFVGVRIAFWALFVLFLILLRILLSVLLRLLNRVMRLPVLRVFNRTGGLLLGVLQGALVLLLVAWLIQLISPQLPAHTVEQTVLLRFLLQVNPFSMLPAQL